MAGCFPVISLGLYFLYFHFQPVVGPARERERGEESQNCDRTRRATQPSHAETTPGSSPVVSSESFRTRVVCLDPSKAVKMIFPFFFPCQRFVLRHRAANQRDSRVGLGGPWWCHLACSSTSRPIICSVSSVDAAVTRVCWFLGRREMEKIRVHKYIKQPDHCEQHHKTCTPTSLSPRHPLSLCFCSSRDAPLSV